MLWAGMGVALEQSPKLTVRTARPFGNQKETGHGTDDDTT